MVYHQIHDDEEIIVTFAVLCNTTISDVTSTETERIICF